MSTRAAHHWDLVYHSRDPRSVSWYEQVPEYSLRSVRSVAPSRTAAIVDVGAGTSLLVDRLLADGYSDVTVLDASAVALDEVRSRLGPLGSAVGFISTDVLSWMPDRQYDAWHDRAVFHFLVADADRAAYGRTLRAALRVGGHAVIATFALDGPESCSGLPTARYDAPTLARAVGPGFGLLRSGSFTHRTPTDVAQPFTWVILRRQASATMEDARAGDKG